MNIEDLKTDIQKIYNFVNIEFNIEDKEEIEEVKKGLELDKIEALDKMLKDYNKQVIRLKRKEQQKQAQKAYKNIQTNLKLEEFKKYEEKAMLEEITISEMTKKALQAYIEPKTVSSEEIAVKNELGTLKGNYEALETTNKELLITLTTQKEEIEDLKHTNKIKTEQNNDKNKDIQDLKKQVEELELKIETDKNYEELTFIQKIKKAFTN